MSSTEEQPPRAPPRASCSLHGLATDDAGHCVVCRRQQQRRPGALPWLVALTVTTFVALGAYAGWRYGGWGAKRDASHEPRIGGAMGESAFDQQPQKPKLAASVSGSLPTELARRMVPQATPEQVFRLELEMLSHGVYIHDLAIFDEPWRKRRGRGFSASELARWGRELGGSYRVLRQGDSAIVYHPHHLQNMPSLLVRTPAGWILDRTLTARVIHMNTSSSNWFAYDDSYPHLAMLKQVFDMQRVELTSGQMAFAPSGT